MSTDKPKKSRSSSKATKADLEAKIAELEAKLNAVSSQLSKSAEAKPAPAPQPKPAPAPQPKPAEVKPQPEVKAPPPAPEPAKQAEVAPSYSSTSSSGYTGNRYYATRQRLAYHPPDKQFRGQVAMTVQVAPPAPAPEPQQMAEPEPTPQEEPRRIEPPAPRVKYTGDNYYRTRQRLAYHPADKQFREAVAVKFDESPTVEQVETTTSSYQEQPKATRSSDRKSRAEQLAEYEKEYLERLSRQPEPEPERAEAPRPRGTMPAGWKPS